MIRCVGVQMNVRESGTSSSTPRVRLVLLTTTEDPLGKTDLKELEQNLLENSRHDVGEVEETSTHGPH